MGDVLCNVYLKVVRRISSTYSLLQRDHFPEFVCSSGAISRRLSPCLLEVLSRHQCANLERSDNSEQKNRSISGELKELINPLRSN